MVVWWCSEGRSSQHFSLARAALPTGKDTWQRHTAQCDMRSAPLVQPPLGASVLTCCVALETKAQPFLAHLPGTQVSHQASPGWVCSSFFSATCAQDRSGVCPLPAQLPFCASPWRWSHRAGPGAALLSLLSLPRRPNPSLHQSGSR